MRVAQPRNSPSASTPGPISVSVCGDRAAGYPASVAPPVYPVYPVDAIAKLLNLTPRRIRQLVAEGVIPRAERGRYDLTRCVRGYVKFLQERAEGAEPNEMSDERVRLVAAQADHEELKVAELQAALLPRDGVLDAWQQLRAAFSAICRAMPPKLSARLAVIQDRRHIQDILTSEVRQALQKCSEYELPDGEPPAGSNGKSRPRARTIPVH
jgi:phage terminase Nu1 subunit (DNA packaging protein)